jgi:hypothetical protein
MSHALLGDRARKPMWAMRELSIADCDSESLTVKGPRPQPWTLIHSMRVAPLEGTSIAGTHLG